MLANRNEMYPNTVCIWLTNELGNENDQLKKLLAEKELALAILRVFEVSNKSLVNDKYIIVSKFFTNGWEKKGQKLLGVKISIF